MQRYTLEKHRLFPYFAWCLIVGFAFFVWHLTTTLAAHTNNLGDSRAQLEAASKSDPSTLVFPTN